MKLKSISSNEKVFLLRDSKIKSLTIEFIACLYCFLHQFEQNNQYINKPIKEHFQNLYIQNL